MSDNNNNDNSNNNNNNDNEKDSSSSNVKFFELEDAFQDDGENVVGTKFFGGSAIKDELYVEEEEERALELQNVNKKSSDNTALIDMEAGDEDRELEYKRFEDSVAFGDDLGREVGMALQQVLNQVLYNNNDDDGKASAGGMASWKEDPSLVWETPLSKTSSSSSPLKELKQSKSFYNKLDVAILSANTLEKGSHANDSRSSVSTVEIRWDIGAVWPNPWESRILLTGTSLLTIRQDEENNAFTLLKQVDRLDGSNPMDVVGSLSSQLSPRFWDTYHIGMSPSTERDPRFDPSSLTVSSSSSSEKLMQSSSSKKGFLANYKLSYLPPRLVTTPSLIDTNGRSGRTAQALPNHGFTTAIKTMGPNKQSFVPVSPIEVSINKLAGEGKEDGSLITWSVTVPPEFASNAVLPLPLIESEEEEEGGGGGSLVTSGSNDGSSSEDNSLDTAQTTSATSPYSPRRPSTLPPKPPTSLSCSYSLRSSRLVATLPYAGNPQDEAVTELRRKLYQEVVERDGYKPKLDPKTKRPMFFFWMNDSKACFTREGGLGMAVYEWRGDWAKSNEVGIELEL